MKAIGQLFLRGLFAVLPLAVTLAVLYWLAASAEATLGALLRWILPPGWYFKGLGIIAGVLFILAMGTLVNAYLFQGVVALTERLLNRIPLVKTIYNSTRDIARFADSSKSRQGMQRTVTVQVADDVRLLGFITKDSVTLGDRKDLIAVYLPMSYQIGGYTLLLPEDRVEKIDMSVQDAMRFILSAGVTGPQTEHPDNNR